jgi:hypothetical protein
MTRLSRQSAIHVINSGKPLLNGAFIDEQAFFIGTCKLKKSLGETYVQLARAKRDDGSGLDSLRLIDELEMLIENGKAHVFGKVWINQHDCLLHLDKVEASFSQYLALDEEWPVEQPASAESEKVQAAQTEAERIIAEAKREAERIVEEARRQRENPWGS